MLRILLKSRESAVGIATGNGLDDRRVGVPSPGGGKNFLFSMSRPAEAHPAFYPVGTGTSFPRVKRPEREDDHSPPTSVEVKKTWVYTPTPPYPFMT
jgi:hypothetical protein